MRRPRSLAIICALAVALAACKGDKPAATGAGSATVAPAAPVAPAGDDPWAKGSPAAPLIEHPLLWAATRDGKTTYLLGTLHLGVNADTQLPPWVKAKLDGARAFAMETDLGDPALMRQLARTDGGSLQLDLGPEHWAKLEALIGADLAKGLDRMKPFAAVSVLSTKFLPQTLPMDSVLHSRAKDAGKELVYLEPAVRQLEIIEPFMTAADIKAFLDHIDFAREQTLALHKAYVTGDADALRAQLDDRTMWLAAGRPPEQFAGYVDALLGNRNASWIPALEQLHAAGGGFVAVGAAHLVGPRSVLELLTARGFTITRVTGP